MTSEHTSIDQQLAEFRSRKFYATPIAGAIAWAFIGVCGLASSSLFVNSMAVFVGTGSIFYLALLVARFTGEDLLGRNRPKNLFDKLFLLTVAQAVAVYAIAIPFFLVEKTTLPMTVGILTALMWIPFSGLVGHWVGIFHAVTRTILVLFLWYAFPEFRFVAIPLAIVLIYLATIAILVKRYHSLPALAPESE